MTGDVKGEVRPPQTCSERRKANNRTAMTIPKRKMMKRMRVGKTKRKEEMPRKMRKRMRMKRRNAMLKVSYQKIE